MIVGGIAYHLFCLEEVSAGVYRDLHRPRSEQVAPRLEI